MRVLFAARILQLKNNKAAFRKWFQQNVYSTRTRVRRQSGSCPSFTQLATCLKAY